MSAFHQLQLLHDEYANKISLLVDHELSPTCIQNLTAYFKIMSGTIFPGMVEETTRLGAWVEDLQSGMYVNCVYCGLRYGPAREVATNQQDMIKQHIAACRYHPMYELAKAAVGAYFLMETLLQGGKASEELMTLIRDSLAKPLREAGVNLHEDMK